MVLAVIATVCAGVFARTVIDITLVEHPDRFSCGTALAVREFRPSYRRAAVMQASLAFLGLVTAVAAWWQMRDTWLLSGGLLLGAVVPFTLFGIGPTNRRPLATDLDTSSDDGARLLKRWGQLYGGRSVLSTVGFVVLPVRIARP